MTDLIKIGKAVLMTFIIGTGIAGAATALALWWKLIIWVWKQCL